MKRKEVRTIASKHFKDMDIPEEFITELLNAVDSELDAQLEQKESEIKELYKDHKSADDYNKLQARIDTLEKEKADATKHAVYKEANVGEEYYEYFDTKFKDSKDLKKDIEDYVKEHPSFAAVQKKEEQQAAPQKADAQKKTVTFQAGGSSQEPGKKNPASLEEAIAEAYKQETGTN